MARCPNVNTAEYKALQEVYKTEIETNSIINSWQNANESDNFPTVVEAAKFVKTAKTVYAFKQKKFGDSVIGNLVNKKLIHMFNGNYVVNVAYPGTQEYNAQAVKDNMTAIYKYLDINNIPTETIDFAATAKTFKVKMLNNVFTPKDILESTRAWDKPRSQKVVGHLQRMFPGITTRLVSVKEAKRIHDNLPRWRKTSGDFAKVNSFYFDKVAYLVKGRVTNETAIEEMLHPFIDAIKVDNESLFNNLLAEAKVNFPEMVQQITEAYNNKRNFNDLDRNLEIVTQALTRHFNSEYESQPTNSFLQLIQDALEWFKNVIENLHEYVTGEPIPVSAINKNATFTDIARLLNTENIEFKIESKASAKLRYSFTPEVQSILDAARSKGNGIQNEVLNQMFGTAEQSKSSKDRLYVGPTETSESGPRIVFNQKNHTYIDVNDPDGQVYMSATTAIKGKLSNKEGEAIIRRDEELQKLKEKGKKPDAVFNKKFKDQIAKGKAADVQKEKDVQLNLDLGNDVDMIVESIVRLENGYEGDISIVMEQAIKQMAVLSREQALEMFGAMKVVIKQFMPVDGIALSQVVVYDEATKLAGTADLVIIDRNGFIRIFDLKTSKNSIDKKISLSQSAGRRGLGAYEFTEWSLPADSRLRSESKDKLGREVTVLSTKGQHNLQVNLYRRMFENMGYNVYDGAFAASTFHVQMDINGKGEKQDYKGTWNYEDKVDHTETKPSENGVYVDMLIPSTVNNKNRKKLQEKINDQPEAPYRGDKDKLAQEEIESNIEEEVAQELYPELNTVFGALQSFSSAIDQAQRGDLNSKKVYSKRSKEQRLLDFAKLQAYIASGISKGPKAQSKIYTGLLSNALKDIREFSDYATDPKNVTGDPEYIGFILNFNRFLATYEPLYAIEGSKELNATQQQLVLNLKLEVDKLIGGTRLVSEGREGIINDAIFNYVKETVRLRSSKQFGVEGSGFTEADLIKELTIVNDIPGIDLQTRDMDTSTDTLLAVVAKIYKSQKQLLLDRIQYREKVIRAHGNKILMLSGENKENAYNYMQNFNEDGTRNGTYVKPIGRKFYDKQKELRDATRDSDNVPLTYLDITDKVQASDADLAFNIDLANKKRAFAEFSFAERVDENGSRIDGEYYSYNQEFIDARNKFEYFVSNDAYEGRWFKKSRVDSVEYNAYEARYYDLVKYNQASRNPNGQPTGVVIKGVDGRFVKNEYKDKNQFRLDKDGNRIEDLRSEKYKAIFDPTKTDALSIAQREFYVLYVKYFEEELLRFLPDSVRQSMLGKNPVVKSNLLDDLKNRPSVVSRMYANSVRGVKNLFQETAVQKAVLLDEAGDIMNSLPIFMVGSPRKEGDLEAVEAKITLLEDDYKKNKINREGYRRKLAELTGEQAKIRSRPLANELSGDLATSLIKFSAMAEHYEVMGQIEDTLTAIQRVVNNRQYEPSDVNTRFVGRSQNLVNKAKQKVDSALDSAISGVTQSGSVGFKKETSGDSNTVRRLRKYMSMVYYDNELITKGAVDKIADLLIQQSSLAYVAFNPFGNFNNYLMGRINNNIEMLGGRFFTKKNFLRAGGEWNKQAITGLVERTGAGVRDLADVATAGLAGIGKSNYDPDYANNKYEAFTQLLRMMDDSTDIRESGKDQDGKSIWERFKEWGYVMQDAAEYNVQSRVGIAMIMDVNLVDEATGETMSMYDAFNFNTKTKELDLEQGKWKVLNKDGSTQEYNDAFRYDLRNKIREVNKQIHGNYASEDRMVIQSHTLGNLAAQFHKWVAPAIRARFQTEYFDENLGWMEGRYKSWFKFMAFFFKNVAQAKGNMKELTESYLKEQDGYDGLGGQADQKGKNKLFGFYRTMGEMAIIGGVFLTNQLLAGLLEGEDDDSDTEKRIKNLTKYQGDRLYKELVLFAVVLPASMEQIFQMAKSPIATTRTMGELGQALSMTIWTPYELITKGKEGYEADSAYVYQNNPNKGQWKLGKEWKDVIPILYTIQKWKNALKLDKFWIK